MVEELSDGAFRDGLSNGLGFERDGDSKVLLATACAKREAAPVEEVRPESIGQALPDDSNTTVLQKKLVEVDEGDIATFTLECSIAGLSMHTKANINLNDDLICNQSVHFKDNTDEHNQHTYRCGDTFEFVIEVRK